MSARRSDWQIEEDCEERQQFVESVQHGWAFFEAEMASGAIKGHRQCERCNGEGCLEVPSFFFPDQRFLVRCEVCLGFGRTPVPHHEPEIDCAMGYDGSVRPTFCSHRQYR